MPQKILILKTCRDDLRCEVYSVNGEDSGLIVKNEAIGVSKQPKYRMSDYPTVMHAVASGWKLMAPPAKHGEGRGQFYEWWLTC